MVVYDLFLENRIGLTLFKVAAGRLLNDVTRDVLPKILSPPLPVPLLC